MKTLLARIRHHLFRPSPRQVTLANARRRAARGAAYLDEVDPGWHRRLDLSMLSLADGRSCVLGQLHGEFRMGLGRVRLFNVGSAPRASLSPVAYGFHCVRAPEEARQRDYAYLDRAWQEEVHRRQQEDEPRMRLPRPRAQRAASPQDRPASREAPVSV